MTIGYNPQGTTKLADLRPQSSHILAYSGPTPGPCAFAHDPHQRNGDLGSNCKDFVYASRTRVDPPAVVRLRL